MHAPHASPPSPTRHASPPYPARPRRTRQVWRLGRLVAVRAPREQPDRAPADPGEKIRPCARACTKLPTLGGLDAVIIAIGGGGTAAGAGTAFRLLMPEVAVYGVEPAGADLMARSFAADGPYKMGAMSGIADSLMAPHTEAYSYGLCRRALAGLVTVTDDELRAAMLLLFEELKLATEPACAAATAAILGPLRERLKGKRVGVLLCGTNTDPATFMRHIEAAQQARQAA